MLPDPYLRSFPTPEPSYFTRCAKPYQVRFNLPAVRGDAGEYSPFRMVQQEVGSTLTPAEIKNIDTHCDNDTHGFEPT